MGKRVLTEEENKPMDKIEIRGYFVDWQEVSREKALEYAAGRWQRCLNTEYKMTAATQFVRGVQFTEEEILDEVKRIYG